MVHFPIFKVEQWMDEYETKCAYNLAETCCDSVPIAQLEEYHRQATGNKPEIIDSALLSKRMTYGHIRGSPELRRNIASLYSEMGADFDGNNVLITQGAIGANFLALISLVGPGDHVVCVHPTYQQLFDVPRSLGADVDLWRLDPGESWSHSLDKLKKLLRPTTKLVIINNPNNPTGQVIQQETLAGIVSAVTQHAAEQCIILSDEVYRPLFHTLDDGAAPPPSILETGYPHAVATGSLSKAWSLAGLRVGWIATPRNDLIELFANRRDYNVISVSILDDAVATHALSPSIRPLLHQRNLDLARTNRAILARWIEATPAVKWVPTQGGTTALLKIGNGLNDEEFCRDLVGNFGTLLAPGSCFDWPGWVRIGYVGNTKELEEGLAKLTEFLQTKPLPRRS